MLVIYLYLEEASSLKAPTLHPKLCRTTSDLVGKAYMAVDQAGACLHTMSILQAFEADFSET